MKRRALPAAAPTLEVVPIDDAARIVTLEDPGGSVEPARGAFARLLPPADHPQAETASWRARVAAVAEAVVVLPTRRSASVPAEDARPREDRGADVRREAREIARERGGEALEAEVERLFGG